ncbi:MAG: hypothetical protein Q8862_00405 [Bacteroidota bacterium]|nr:hypothetical protein [Bacteroidota bacterium]MDP4204683.1 hypothetical protein [Bacteroidota bacterium]
MRKILLILMLAGFSSFSYGQKEVVTFIQAGKADATKLFHSYLQPYAISLGDGLNNGWFTTAQSHKFLGFDISIGVSAVQVPSSDKQFDLNSLSFSKIKVSSGSNSITPTVAGSSNNGPKLDLYDVVNGQTVKIASFDAPGGTGYSLVPVPMVQVGFGLLPHTDVIGRYVPKMSFGSGDQKMQIGLMGLGLKNDFKSMIPFFRHLPFDMAVYGGYTRLTADAGLDFQPSAYGNNIPVVDYVETNDQKLSITTKSLTYGLIVSKKLGPLTFFGSVGNSNSKSSVDLLGKYPVVTINTTNVPPTPQITEKDALHDPIALDYNNSSMTLNGGLRIKLLFFSVYGSVTKANYTSYNAGVSFGFR